ncbi:MAG TPA: hypothetical protein VEC12_10560 [Bacteroidia bacterium]|nr:hypothetical protein [Bacteroidia bacterium]
MSVNTITLSEAEQWQHNWLSATSEAFDPMKLRSFLIPLDDLRQVIDEMGVSNARGILGITDDGEYKFMLVGVTDDDATMVNPFEGEHIYDMTTPCPPECGTGPLSTDKPGTIKKATDNQ